MGHREKVLIDGVEAPSVTTVLNVVNKPYLLMWYGKHGTAKCKEILEASQEIGHRVHAAIEAFYRGEELPELTAQEVRMFMDFKNWALASKFNPIELELNVQSKEYLYQGTFDAIGTIDDKTVIIDWKTSGAVDPLYGAQLAAYSQGYKEMTGKEITEGIVVRMDKKPDAKVPFEAVEFHDLPKYFGVFKTCLDLWCFVNRKRQWSK